MGMGSAKGKGRAAAAAAEAAASPLLDFPVSNARSILFCMRGPPDMSLSEVNEAARVITDASNENANVIFGAIVDPLCEDTIDITVVATGMS